MLTAPQNPARAPQTPVAPPAADQSPAVGQLSTDELHAQVQVLSGQIAGLNAERSGLMAQLRTAPAGDRTATVAELDRVNHQVVIATGQLANVRAQLAIREANSETRYRNQGNLRSGFDPDVVAGLAFAFIFAVMMPIAIAYSRRIWRGKPAGPSPRPDDLSGARLERLEQAVDSIAIEIERVSEGQRFVTKVLTERMPVVGMSRPAGESADPQLRALGAGPIEPIRAAERQVVRPSITPH